MNDDSKYHLFIQCYASTTIKMIFYRTDKSCTFMQFIQRYKKNS